MEKTMKCPWPILWLDADNRLAEMTLAQKYMNEMKLIVWPVTEPLFIGSLRVRQTKYERKGSSGFQTLAAPINQPKGYIQLLEYMDAIPEAIKKLGIRTIILDPVTRVVEHMMRFLAYQTKHGVIEESAWGIYLSNLEELMGTLLALPVNVGVVLHDREYRDEDTGHLLQVKPLLSGQMQAKIGSYFAEVYHTECKDEGGVTKWRIRTQPSPNHNCRTSRPLDAIEPAHFPTIMKKGIWDAKPWSVMAYGPFGTGKSTMFLSLCELPADPPPVEEKK
jgi:hypothetical protein